MTRILTIAALVCLVPITLFDRGTSRMYAWPWSLCYWGAILAPALLLVLRASQRTPLLRLPARPWLWLVAAAWMGLLASAWASPYRAMCLQWTALPLAGLATFLLAHDWLQTSPANRARLETFQAGAAGVLMLASAAYWVADLARLRLGQIFSATLFDMRNPHPLGHSNYTAGLALLSLPWLAQAAMRHRTFARRAALMGGVLAILVLFTSGSRGGLLGLAALGAAGVANAKLGRKRFLMLAGLAVVASGLLAVANPRIRAMLSPPNPMAEPNASTVQRHAMFKAGLSMGADRPVLGWGTGTPPLAFPRYRGRLDGGAENVLQLHSLPLEVWAGTGAVGLLVCAAFLGLAFRGWSRAPTAAAALAGYAVFSLTDYQLDVPVVVLALAALGAQLASPSPAPASLRLRLGFGTAALVSLAMIALVGRRDPTTPLNTEALALAREPSHSARAITLLRESLALNPDQEIAHFNLGWLLVVPDPTTAEKHFLATARLVPDKGGVYFGIGLARLNRGDAAGAAHSFALECLNDPRFLASPWWTVPAIAAQRGAAAAAFATLAQRARAALPNNTWAAQQSVRLATLAPRLGVVSAGPESAFRRERTGYPVLMRNHNLAPPLDLFDVREDPRFAPSVPFHLPPKGWLPGPVLLNLLDDDRVNRQ